MNHQNSELFGSKPKTAIFCKCTQSDSSLSDNQTKKAKRKQTKKQNKNLPPIGVFWDIENCHVPKNRSAAILVQRIREIFFDGYREAEFIVVCDVRKEKLEIIQDLNDAQVNLIHVSSTSKNAADEKLKQSIRRFAEIHSSPAAVVLITGDVNFAADLSDLRYRKKIHVILVHSKHVADALVLCANETFTYSTITEDLPLIRVRTPDNVDLLVTNLPTMIDTKLLKSRLKFLSYNCGGRVIEANNVLGWGILRFTSYDFALRAQRRLNGEDVFGRKIIVSNLPESRGQLSFRKPVWSNNTNDAIFGEPSSSNPTLRNQNAYPQQISMQERNVHKTPRNTNQKPQPNWQQRPDSNQFGGGFNKNYSEQLTNASFQLSQQSNDAQMCGLIISNLDPAINDIRVTLGELLKPYTNVLDGYISFSLQIDGTLVAFIRVDKREAQNIISKLHHSKLGSKRLSVSYAPNNIPLDELKDMVVQLLLESPLKCMPVFRLIQLLDERYLVKTSLSEVNKLRDVCKVIDENGIRLILLAPEVRKSPPRNKLKMNVVCCEIHCPNGLKDLCVDDIIYINMPLNSFAQKVNQLLSSHMDVMPLLSFSFCYEAEFGQPLSIDNSGVPLEHLITCVKFVKLTLGGVNKNLKFITRNLEIEENEEQVTDEIKSLSPSISINIGLLKRKLIELLKIADRCQLAISRFIPVYHHHFGHQLRLADYGYTKLTDLLSSEPISKIIHILGEGDNRLITLTHIQQKRRFTSDLLRMLKTQNSKQFYLNEFSEIYENIFNRRFNPTDYGVCTLDDLLDEISKNTIKIAETNDNRIEISIPKIVQTIDEVWRTKQFAIEVIDLLSYSPQCSIQFNKFIPSYHHHFGYQCKLSNFGFAKLIELFEAIPETVRVDDQSDSVRRVTLTEAAGFDLRGRQIANLIQKSRLSLLPLEALPSFFEKEYGYPLVPQFYGCKDIKEFVYKLDSYIKVFDSNAGPLLFASDKYINIEIGIRVWALLISPPHELVASQLIEAYALSYDHNINLSKIQELHTVTVVYKPKFEGIVKLTPLYEKAAKLYMLIVKEGAIALTDINNAFTHKYGSPMFTNDAEKIFTELSFMIVMRSMRRKTIVTLNPKLIDLGISLKENDNPSIKKVMDWLPGLSANDLLARNKKPISPPKPDTPQSPESAAFWMAPNKKATDLDFYIDLPEPQLALFSGIDNLISPAKGLLSAYPQTILPPQPSQLPLPDKLLKKEESGDSGVTNSNITSENEMDRLSELFKGNIDDTNQIIAK